MIDKKDIKTIWVAADFISTKISEQNNNLRWFIDLLRPPLKRAGFDVRIASQKFEAEWSFDRDRYIFLSGVKHDVACTHVDLEGAVITEQMQTMVHNAFGEKPFIIGYEMSPTTLSVLDLLGIPYLDIWLGPIRFLDDITFALRSNIPFINDVLLKSQISDEVIFANANILKVQSYRGFSKSYQIFRENTAVFAGQLLTDKSLMHKGRMLSILDFKEEFAQICKDYKEVIYARHPFIKSGDEEILNFVYSFRNVQISDKSGYYLLTDDAIKMVCGITSSLISEAYYFEKKIHYFSRPPINIISTSCPYYLISHRLLLGSFWKSLLADADIKHVNDFSLGKDRLRDALSFYWSYREIDKLEYIRRNLATLKGDRK